jgi:hypothetical protein
VSSGRPASAARAAVKIAAWQASRRVPSCRPASAPPAGASRIVVAEAPPAAPGVSAGAVFEEQAREWEAEVEAAKEAKAAKAAKAAQREAESTEASWWAEYVAAKAATEEARQRQLEEDEEAEERAFSRREKERAAAAERHRLELDERRAKTRAAAARVDKMMAAQKVEYAAMKHAAERAEAHAKAAAKASKKHERDLA